MGRRLESSNADLHSGRGCARSPPVLQGVAVAGLATPTARVQRAVSFVILWQTPPRLTRKLRCKVFYSLLSATASPWLRFLLRNGVATLCAAGPANRSTRVAIPATQPQPRHERFRCPRSEAL